jgi:rSAM/selenodomain-associated transferase 2
VITVIVPFYNEEKILCKNLIQFHALSRQAELIFVDGGSTDKSVDCAKQYGRVYYSKRGRAAQMNMGASVANGGVLLFLHADTIISPETLLSMENSIKDDSYVGGCLEQRIDNIGMIYRFIEGLGNVRAKITKVFYGDQGIFVRKDIFLKIGGFPKVPIMEDVIFSKQLRRLGKTVVLTDRILTSSRRWDKGGVVKTLLLYSLINILFWMRFPLEKIKLFYDDLR